MKQIPLGATGTSTLRVAPEHLANRFKDAMLPQVLATPVMILIMENAALNAIRPFLDAGESAVGVAVDVKHLAATPVGHEVRATAEVVGVDGKRIDFKVSARDGKEGNGNPISQCFKHTLRFGPDARVVVCDPHFLTSVESETRTNVTMRSAIGGKADHNFSVWALLLLTPKQT